MTELLVGEQGCSKDDTLPFGHARSAKDEILLALAELGELADRTVLVGQTKFFGDHLGWPDWLTHGTSFEGRPHGDIPNCIALRDDLLIHANIIDAGFADEMVALLAGEERLPGSPSTALVLMTEPTLGATLQRFSGKLVTDNPEMLTDLVVQDGLLRFRVGYRVRLGKVGDYISTLVHIMLKQIIKAIAPGAMLELSLEIVPALSPLPPANPGPLDEDAETVSDTGSAVLTLPARWFDYRNPVYDPALNPLIEAAIEQSVSTNTGEQVDADRIRARIAASLDREWVAPRLKQIALELGIPTRTIVRRLRGEGTSFHDLVDGERQRRARVLIANPQVPLKSVAEQLGFPDASSFGRAFRRWYGKSPGCYRTSLNESAGKVG